MVGSVRSTFRFEYRPGWETVWSGDESWFARQDVNPDYSIARQRGVIHGITSAWDA